MPFKKNVVKRAGGGRGVGQNKLKMEKQSENIYWGGELDDSKCPTGNDWDFPFSNRQALKNDDNNAVLLEFKLPPNLNCDNPVDAGTCLTYAAVTPNIPNISTDDSIEGGGGDYVFEGSLWIHGGASDKTACQVLYYNKNKTPCTITQDGDDIYDKTQGQLPGCFAKGKNSDDGEVACATTTIDIPGTTLTTEICENKNYLIVNLPASKQ